MRFYKMMNEQLKVTEVEMGKSEAVLRMGKNSTENSVRREIPYREVDFIFSYRRWPRFSRARSPTTRLRSTFWAPLEEAVLPPAPPATPIFAHQPHTDVIHG